MTSVVRPDYVLPFIGSSIYLLPIAAALNGILTLLPAYLMACSKGHIVAFWPFIDDVHACAPESCVFAQFLNFTCLFLALTYYFRYKMTADLRPDERPVDGRLATLNLVGLRVGLVSAGALFLAANFVEKTVPFLHTIGVWTSTALGLIYWWIQVRSIEPRLRVGKYRSRAARLRQLLVAAATAASIAVLLCLLWVPEEVMDIRDAVADYCWTSTVPEDRWDRPDHGFQWLTAAALAEWTVAGSFILLLLTLVLEFQESVKLLMEEAAHQKS